MNNITSQRMKDMEISLSGLSNQGINYWIESGTLLACIREGEPFNNDDYDIGVLATDLVKLVAVIRSEYKDSQIKVYRYHGKTYKIKIINKNNSIIDIQVYYEDKDSFVSPQKIPKEFLHIPLKYKILYHLEKERTGYEFFFSKIVGRVMDLAHIDKNWIYFDIDSTAISIYYDLYTWVVRKKYIKEQGYFQSFRIPKAYENYLTERYGNWQVPNKEWDFTTDDKTLIHINTFESVMR